MFDEAFDAGAIGAEARRVIVVALGRPSIERRLGIIVSHDIGVMPQQSLIDVVNNPGYCTFAGVMPLVLLAVASDAPRALNQLTPISRFYKLRDRGHAGGCDDLRFPRSAETEQTRKARIGEKKTNGTTGMKAILGCAALALAVTAATVSADAKGCIKGAIVGGVAGHVAGHHGVLGAAAGCIVGHHEATKHEKALQSSHEQR
jgi:hypothetical protein